MASRLEALFRRYSVDLERYAPVLRGQFGCPICLNAIHPVPDLGTVVAEEHIVPQALGGRMVTLTCRSCNNASGSRLESHLVQRVLVDSRKRPVKTRVGIGGSVHRAEMFLPETREAPIKLTVVGRRSDPRQIAEAQRHLREGKSDINLQMNFGYIESRTVVGLLRSAYLLMFRTFGYSYVLDRSAAPIRAQILNPTQETSVLNGVAWRLPEPVPSGNWVTVIANDHSKASFVVLVQLSNEPIHVGGIALPPPGDDGSELYSQVRSAPWRKPMRLRPVPTGGNHFLHFAGTWKYLVADDAT